MRSSVNSIISHPMDTGFFRTADGQPIPAWFIKEVVVTYAGQEIARFEWTSGISRDPVVTFMLKADKEGPLTMVWTDNKGSSFTKTRGHHIRVRLTAFSLLPSPFSSFTSPQSHRGHREQHDCCFSSCLRALRAFVVNSRMALLDARRRRRSLAFHHERHGGRERTTRDFLVFPLHLSASSAPLR